MNRNLIVIPIIVFALMAGFIVFGTTVLRHAEEAPITSVQEEEEQISSETGSISPKEKELIDAWIIENDLNEYGDSKDTVYIGGTPLFDERTAERTDKYEYVIDNYPDKPWLK